MHIKYLIFLSLVIILKNMVLNASEPIFSVSFDKSFKAEKAVGNPQGLVGEEVNLETMDIYLKKGIAGNALLTGVSDDGKNSLCCKYNAEKNILIDQGTILLWVQPVDWSGIDKKFKIFFEAENIGTKDRLIIYKFVNSNDLFFILGPNKQDNGIYDWTLAKTSIKKWELGCWYFIACTWNKDELKLYINGELTTMSKIKKAISGGPFKEFGVGGLSPKDWKNATGKTLIDEVEIYGIALSEKDIFKKWENRKISQKQIAPEIMLGQTGKSPIVDGIINKGEYVFSACGFYGMDGKFATEQSKYFLNYDEKNIYIGVVTNIGEKLRSDCFDRDGQLWTDDSIDVLIMPEISTSNYFHFIFNSKGIFYDSEKNNALWNAANLLICNKIIDKEWIFEVAIPFKELKAKYPSRDVIWKINICRTYANQSIFTAISPVKKGYNDLAHFALLRFNPDAPLLNFKSIGKILEGDLDVDLEIKSKSSKNEIQALVNLDQNGKKVVNFNNKYELTPDKICKVYVKKDKLEADGTVKIELNSPIFGKLYSATFPFLKASPMVVSYIYTDTKKQVLNINVKFDSSLFKDNLRLMSTIRDLKGRICVQKTYHPDKQIFESALDIAGLTAGDYTLEVASLDKSGNVVYCYQQLFNKPSNPAPWKSNKIGITDIVPVPWTPMKINGPKVICWGREYLFDKTILPSEIISNNNSILATPMRFSTMQNGKFITHSSGTNKYTDCKENVIRLETSSETDKIRLKSQVLIEYDGFMWIEFELSALDNPVKIDRLSLEIPMKPKFATLVHNCEKGYNFRSTGTCSTGAVPTAGWHKNIFKKPVFWVGNEDVGILWFASEMSNWSVINKEKSVEIIPGTKETTVKVNIIDHPVEIKGVRKFAFGIQATPVRPLNNKWRNLRVGKEIVTWFPWTDLFNYPDAKFANKEKIEKKLAQYKGKEIFWYLAIYAMTPFSPEWPYWAMEWGKIPPQLGTMIYPESKEWAAAYVCPNSISYRDFYMWKLETALKEMKIKNLYFDLGVPRGCYNKEHGCGWRDDNGVLCETYNILGTRELAKRIYVLLKQHNPDGLIMSHMTEEPVMPVLAFTDLLADGENYCQQIAEQESYYDIFSPELFRAAYMSRQWGPISTFIPQFERSSKAYRPERLNFWKTAEAQKPINHFVGYMLLHDAVAWPSFGLSLANIWKIQDDFGWDDKVKFLPYWEKNNVVKLSTNSKKIMMSAYIRPDKLMIVAMNDTDKEENVIIAVDMERVLACKKNGETKKAFDPFDGKSYNLINNNIDIKLPPRGFRIIEIK